MSTHIPEPRQREKPLLIYDGDCTFCKFWVEYWKTATGERVDYAPFQEIAPQFPEIPLDNFRAAAQFVDCDDSVSAGAEAVYRLMAHVPGKGWTRWCYEHVPGVDAASASLYNFIARRRSGFYRVTRLLWGKRLEPARFALTRSTFLRLLGIVYLIAFASWFVQVRGLIGSHGILPADRLLSSVPEEAGFRRYLEVPTLFWFHPTDAALRALTAAGIALSLPVIFGFATGPCLVLLWMLYLSQVSIGQEFMAFQWDILLLETGFLAIFFAPWSLRGSRAAAPSTAFVWLFRWLVFRVYFLSGAVKLLSGDPSWRNLTAMSYHYQTQPLPTPIAWYMQQLPLAFQKFSTLIVFGIELLAPLFIFATRRFRIGAAFWLLALQVLIFLTGNYCFFNLLTIALCLFLFDDAALRRLAPKRFRERQLAELCEPPVWRRIALGCLTVFLLFLSTLHFAGTFGLEIPETAAAIGGRFEPFYITSSYGLFAVMTTRRPEIIVEGSNDAEHWLAYQFVYKPGDLARPPRWVAPHQPRLDWQMWFAALGSYRSNQWMINFVVRLLEGAPDVLKLMEGNPFPGRPPQYIRALVYDYRFTTFAERKATGNWWAREEPEVYLPPVSLK
jgi:predicted DCC family thiol-disulfide oxidoreductase YuxK